MGEWKPGKSFFWDDSGKFLEPSWNDLKERIGTESGGIAIAADDFAYLLQYDMGYRRHHSRRECYSELAAHIAEKEDLDILSKVISIMVMQHRVPEAAWAIYFLRVKNGGDFRRQGVVLNRLYDISPEYTKTLVHFLAGNFLDLNPLVTIIDNIRNAGYLREEIVRIQ